MRGADNVVRELIRTAVARTFDSYFHGANLQQVVQWFDLGGSIKVAESAASGEVAEALKGIQGLSDKLGALGLKTKDSPELQVSAAEFVLEGLYAHKRIGRSEERVFSAGEKTVRRSEPSHPDRGDEPPVPRPRRPYN